jgi:hypothetical protein
MLLAPKDLPGRHFYGDDVRSKLPLGAWKRNHLTMQIAEPKAD